MLSIIKNVAVQNAFMFLVGAMCLWLTFITQRKFKRWLTERLQKTENTGTGQLCIVVLLTFSLATQYQCFTWTMPFLRQMHIQ